MLDFDIDDIPSNDQIASTRYHRKRRIWRKAFMLILKSLVLSAVVVGLAYFIL